MPTLLKQLQTARDDDPHPPPKPVSSLASRRSSSSKMGVNRTSHARAEARLEFLRITTKDTQDEVYINPESLPSVEKAYNDFQRIYPKFSETWAVDDLRDREYYHLEESRHVCMDYCGFGLFSYYQQVINKATSSFGLAYISANLPTHALYGAADEGTTEFYIRKRVMDYLNVNDAEYSMVFTASRGSAFKLLAESYPFHLNPKLLTVYDFESEAVNWMAECAKQKGAKIISASFKWPSLRIGTSHLKKLLQEKKKRSESVKGLFVFPVQSRMTGAKYSYQWMSQAQQNKWHVLLDASALGPKDMDSLGLSLFRPDFIVSSFYKIFGADPTGFGCLFIKNTAIQSLHNSSRARAVGMVRIVSLSNYAMDGPDFKESEDDDSEEEFQRSVWESEQDNVQAMRSFSGPYLTAAETELKPEDFPKANNQRAWKSWKTNGKIASHSAGHSGQLTGFSLAPMDTVIEVEQGGPREMEDEAQLTRSRCYAERRASKVKDESQIHGSETEHSWELTENLNGSRVNEIQELGDDMVSGAGSRGHITLPQWHVWRRVSEIEEEEEQPLKSQSFTCRKFSPIWEEDVEDQEFEELGSSAQSTKANETVNRNGGAHIAFTDGVGSGSEEHASFLERKSLKVLSETKAEVVKAVEEMPKGLSDEEGIQHDASSDLREPEIVEIVPGNVTLRRRQNTANEVSEVEEMEGPRESLPGSEESNDVVKHHALGKEMSEADSQSFFKGRLQWFEGDGMFKRLTGKELIDVQEMGVQGSVQKFHNSRTEVYKGLEGTRQMQSDLPLYKQRGPVGTVELVACKPPKVLNAASKAGRNPSPSQNFMAAAAEEDGTLSENVAESVAPKPAYSYPSTSDKPAGNIEEMRVVMATRNPGHAVSESGNCNPSADGNLAKKLDNEAHETEDESGYWNQGETSFVETETEAMNGSAGCEASAPAGEILPIENVGEPTLMNLTLQQRHSAKELKVGPEFSERFSQELEFPQEQSMTGLSCPTSEGGKLSTPLTRIEFQIVDQKDAWDVSELGKSPVYPSPDTMSILSFPHTDKGVRESLLRSDKLDTLIHNNVGVWRGAGAGGSTGANSWPDMAPTTPHQEVLCMNECKKFVELEKECMLTRGNAVHNLQHSASTQAEGGTPYESGEENYITILPSRAGKKWRGSWLEPVIKAGTSGYREQMEYMPSKDISSCPAGRPSVEYLGDEGRAFEPSRKSPCGDLDSILPSVSTPLHHMVTLKHNSYEKGITAANIGSDTANFHNARVQGLKNGRFDLRSNRTLSRDVDFEDEMDSGRLSSPSEMLASRKQAMISAETIARGDMQDIDKESFCQSQYYSGLFQRSSTSRYLVGDLLSASYCEGEEGDTDDNFEDIPETEFWEFQKEPVVSCKGLDFADSLGLTKLNYRIRYLINWLVNSLLKLRHPGSNQGISLVRIYGPKVQYDRGAAVSFNVFDWKGLLIQPVLVQKLADRSNISLGVGQLCNIVDPDMSPDFTAEVERLLGVGRSDYSLDDSFSYSGKLDGGRSVGAGKPLRIPVVTAVMGFVTSFEDVYKLWSFLAKFLDADFVSKEVWKYHSLNQQTIVI